MVKVGIDDGVRQPRSIDLDLDGAPRYPTRIVEVMDGAPHGHSGEYGVAPQIGRRRPVGVGHIETLRKPGERIHRA